MDGTDHSEAPSGLDDISEAMDWDDDEDCWCGLPLEGHPVICERCRDTFSPDEADSIHGLCPSCTTQTDSTDEGRGSSTSEGSHRVLSVPEPDALVFQDALPSPHSSPYRDVSRVGPDICDVRMPISRAHCVLPSGHGGHHRARP